MEIIHTKESGVWVAAKRSADVLRAGGIVLYPTDTLYGLAVDAANPVAVSKLVELKGRDASKAISVVMKDLSMISEYALVSQRAEKLINSFLPGALTLVLPLINMKLRGISSDMNVGVRIPDDEFTKKLSQEFEGPYTATSANISGEAVLSRPEGILEQLKERAKKIDLVVDDGPRSGAIPSTVVKISGDKIEVLREGAIPATRLCF